MDLKSPWTLALAWALVPLAITAASACLGIAVSAVSGLRLGGFTLPAGFLTGIAFMGFLVELGIDGNVVAILCAALALGALAAVVLVARRRGGGLAPARLAAALGVERPGAAVWAGLCLIAAYAICMAPLAGSGRAGVVGYVLNDDPSVHASVVELLRAHGARAYRPDDSSFNFVSTLFDSGYPLGSHTWALFGSVVGGIGPFFIWTPVSALAAAMIALTGYGFMRRLSAPPAFAAVAGTAIGCGYLTYSYLAQGGLKEVVFALSVYATIGLFAVGAGVTSPSWRALLPSAVGAAASVYTLGLGAAAWLGPALVAGLALVLAGRHGAPWRRRALPAVAAPALLAAALAAPAVAASATFLEGSSSAIENPAQVGNLLGPVPWREAFNIWLGADYRFSTPLHTTPTWAGIALAAAFAVLGLLWTLRRARLGVPLAVLAGAAGAIFVSARYAIYFEAKAYMALAPALGLATAAGVLALYRRRGRAATVAAIAAGIVLVAGVAVSDGYVYRGAWVTPKQRFNELIDFDRRLAGKGPVLVHDRENWAKYLLRDAQPWDSWNEWQPDRGFRFGPIPPTVPRTPDFDDYALSFIGRFPYLLERKRPGGSVPPGNYRAVAQTPHYRLWRRVAPTPKLHVALGDGTPSGLGRLDCGSPEVRALFQAARRSGAEVRVSFGRPRPTPPTTPAWYTGVAPGPAPLFAFQRGGFANFYPHLTPGLWDAWIQGGFGPGFRLFIGNRPIGDVFGDLGIHDEWTKVGTFRVEKPRPTLAYVGLAKPWWQSGSAHDNLVGPLVFTRASEVSRVERMSVRAARRLCGRALDWIELP